MLGKGRWCDISRQRKLQTCEGCHEALHADSSSIALAVHLDCCKNLVISFGAPFSMNRVLSSTTTTTSLIQCFPVCYISFLILFRDEIKFLNRMDIHQFPAIIHICEHFYSFHVKQLFFFLCGHVKQLEI